MKTETQIANKKYFSDERKKYYEELVEKEIIPLSILRSKLQDAQTSTMRVAIYSCLLEVGATKNQAVEFVNRSRCMNYSYDRILNNKFDRKIKEVLPFVSRVFKNAEL